MLYYVTAGYSFLIFCIICFSWIQCIKDLLPLTKHLNLSFTKCMLQLMTVRPRYLIIPIIVQHMHCVFCKSLKEIHNCKKRLSTIYSISNSLSIEDTIQRISYMVAGVMVNHNFRMGNTVMLTFRIRAE